MSLLTLPLEIHSAIIKQISQLPRAFREPSEEREFKSLRLVCKQLSNLATPELFRIVRLLPMPESIERWNQLLRHAHLRDLVQEIVLDTFPQKNWARHRALEKKYRRWSYHFDWIRAVDQMHQFPNAQSVLLRFSGDCQGVENSMGGTREYMQLRLHIMMDVFKAIDETNRMGSRKIRSLSIKNMQNIVEDALVESECFRNVMAELEELHIGVCTEYDGASPEYSIFCVEVRSFWSRFENFFLKPIAGQLKALTIYIDAYWGVITRCDLHTIQFPKLKYLALGNYIMSYMSQVDWIVSHTGLNHLSFDDCTIGHYFIVEKDSPFEGDLDKPRIDKKLITPKYLDKILVAYESSLRWDVILQRIKNELPYLTDFRFDHGNWRSAQAFEDRHKNGIALPYVRYLCFHFDSCPSQWCQPDGKEHKWYQDETFGKSEDGEYQISPPSGDKEVVTRERQALLELVKVLTTRISRIYNSSIAYP